MALIIVAACAPSKPPDPPEPDQTLLTLSFANETTEALWAKQATTIDSLELLMIEAELGARGQFENKDLYLGSRTSSTVGLASYLRSEPVLNDRSCADFSSAASAQRFFLSAGGPNQDPYGLDRDGDGNACEWGVKLREISSARIAPLIPKVSSYSSACHVGPEGGTYTITASGSKDYDGC